MMVEGVRFVVELKPFHVNAFQEALRNEDFRRDYEHHEMRKYTGLPDNDHDYWYVEEDGFNLLKEVVKMYYIGEDNTLCLEFKRWPPEISFPYPKSVALPQRVDGTGDLCQHPKTGKIEWDNGVKQCMHNGSYFDTTATYYDFVQQVKTERRKRGLDAVIEVAGEPTVEAATVSVGRLEVIRRNEAVEYEGKPYHFTEPKAWENLYKLIDGRGAYVRCDAGLKKYFTSKDAKAFYKAAIKPKGAGRKGNGTYKLNI